MCSCTLLFTPAVHAVCSHFCSQLAAVAEALCCLLWPFRWQGVFIPLLPVQMVEIMQSPVPFLLGVHPDVLAAAELNGLVPPDAIVARFDEGVVHAPPELELPPLPQV